MKTTRMRTWTRTEPEAIRLSSTGHRQKKEERKKNNQENEKKKEKKKERKERTKRKKKKKKKKKKEKTFALLPPPDPFDFPFFFCSKTASQVPLPHSETSFQIQIGKFTNHINGCSRQRSSIRLIILLSFWLIGSLSLCSNGNPVKIPRGLPSFSASPAATVLSKVVTVVKGLVDDPGTKTDEEYLHKLASILQVPFPLITMLSV